jgi:hypothetical protein
MANVPDGDDVHRIRDDEVRSRAPSDVESDIDVLSQFRR